MQHHLILYSKEDCHLCHEAHDLLRQLQREFDFTLNEFNIADDPTLEAQYRYAIPVVVIDGQLELAAPIHEHELRAALQLKTLPHV